MRAQPIRDGSSVASCVGLTAFAALVLMLGTKDSSAQSGRPNRPATLCPPCDPHRPSFLFPSDRPGEAHPGTHSPSPNGEKTPGADTVDPNQSPNRDPNANQNPNQTPDAAQNNPLTNPDQVFNNAPSAPTSLASNSNPGSIGDFFGHVSVGTQYAGTFAGSIGSINRPATGPGPYTPLAGRQKFVENGNSLPQDRFFVNYSFFKDVPLVEDSIHVHRATVGLERTIFNGRASLEARLPTASTLDNDVRNQGIASSQFESDRDVQLGNIHLIAKILVAQTEKTALAIGTGVTLPTAEDIRLYGDADAVALRYDNKSVHFLPFISYSVQPTSRMFSQAVVQFDIDSNGNGVYVTNDAGEEEDFGSLKDSAYLFASYTTGFWLTRQVDANGQISRGIAPMFELHYNRTLNNPDTLRGTTTDGVDFGIGRPLPGDLGPTLGSFEALNLTFGVHSQLSSNCTMTVGYVLPAAGHSRNDQFNGEGRLLFNYFFGK